MDGKLDHLIRLINKSPSASSIEAPSGSTSCFEFKKIKSHEEMEALEVRLKDETFKADMVSVKL